MKYVKSSWRAFGASVLCALWFFVSDVAVGQDMDVFTSKHQMEMSHPISIASGMLGRCDLVADGEFKALPKYSPEELRALVIEDVTIKFRAHKLYKGPQRDAFDIRLTNELLEFPGEGISRFAKRERILEKQWRDKEPLLEQFRAATASYEAGAMNQKEYFALSDEIAFLLEEREKMDGLADRHSRIIILTHVNTFYENGGAIAPDRNYLICVNRLPEGAEVYMVEEIGARNSIFWGEVRDYILPGFDDALAHEAQ